MTSNPLGKFRYMTLDSFTRKSREEEQDFRKQLLIPGSWQNAYMIYPPCPNSILKHHLFTFFLQETERETERKREKDRDRERERERQERDKSPIFHGKIIMN